MWTYLARRLLLMLVTLFGITLVTWGIMRLTPGDPAERRIQQLQMAGKAGGQGFSKEDLERVRAHFGLNKPAFFNFRPADRRSHLEQRLGELDSKSEETRKELPAKLEAVGAAGLLPGFALLAEAERKGDAKQAGSVLRALPLLAGALRGAPQSGADALGWKAWWERARGALAEPAPREAVERLAASRDPRGVAALREGFGALANAHLSRALARAAGESRHVLALALAAINKKPNWALDPSVAPTSPEGERRLERYAYLWRNWNEEEGSHFRDLGTAERLARTVTETQYGTWIGKLVRGDFGESTSQHRPVMEILPRRLAVTVQLALISIFLAYLVAIPLGILSAAKPYTLRDRVTTTGLFILYSLPSFWVGNLMVLFFTGGTTDRPAGYWLQAAGLLGVGVALLGVALFLSDRLSRRAGVGLMALAGLPGLALFAYSLTWFDFFPYASTRITPSAGLRTWLLHLALPIACYTYGSFAYLSRQMRAAMMETIRADFIRTARAKGLAERVVIFKHALRNSLIPILTIMANILPILIGGSVIIESIFTIEGMGELAFQSVLNRDYPVVMAIGFFSAVLTLVGILLSDLSYALVDPRITYD